MTTKTLTPAERVAAGAAWLDANHPGWVDRIDLSTLKLESCLDCILGQLYGDFCDRPAELRVDWNGGYDAPDEQFGFADPDGRYAELNAEWRALIAARREVSA